MYQDDVVLSNCLWASMERCRCKSSFKWHSVTCWTCGAHNLFKTIQMSCIYIARKHNHTASVSFTICKVSDTSPSIWEGENLPCWGKKKKKKTFSDLASGQAEVWPSSPTQTAIWMWGSCDNSPPLCEGLGGGEGWNFAQALIRLCR